MSAPLKPLELTLAILKPHIVKYPLALENIRNIILTSNFKIARSKRHAFSLKDASRFYEEHNGKFFYNRLVTFMTSGPSDLYILARHDAIKEWRRLMGPTKVYKTQFEAPDTIRGEFGFSDTRNATHGSDSVESFRRETEILFPEFDVDQWFEKDELDFRNGNLVFDENNFVHRTIQAEAVLNKCT